MAEFVLVVDKGTKAQAFTFHNHEEVLVHMVATVAELVAGDGYCLVCKRVHELHKDDIDIRIWSPPCQPYSAARFKKGDTAVTGACDSHPGFGVTDSDIPEVPAANPSKLTIVEEVKGFLEVNPATHTSPCQKSTQSLDNIYGEGATQVVHLDGGLWMQGSRKRYCKL